MVQFIAHRARTSSASRIWVIDGINSFPFFRVGETICAVGLGEHPVLENILIARDLTYHQLTELTTEKLPRSLDPFCDALVIVAGFVDLYVSPEARQCLEYDQKAATHSLLGSSRTDQAQTTLTIRYKLAMIVTTHLAGERYLQQFVGTNAQMKRKPTIEYWRLQHHPSLGEQEMSLLVTPRTGCIRSPQESFDFC